VQRLAEAFPRKKTSETAFDGNGLVSTYSPDYVTWLGQSRYKPGQGKDMPYFRDRDELASAAWSGNWAKMETLMARGCEVHHQKWGNAWRIRAYIRSPHMLYGIRSLWLANISLQVLRVIWQVVPQVALRPYTKRHGMVRQQRL
jgi:hypothetical protein